MIMAVLVAREDVMMPSSTALLGAAAEIAPCTKPLVLLPGGIDVSDRLCVRRPHETDRIGGAEPVVPVRAPAVSGAAVATASPAVYSIHRARSFMARARPSLATKKQHSFRHGHRVLQPVKLHQGSFIPFM